MAGETSFYEVKGSPNERLEFFEQLDAPGITSPAVRLEGSVMVQLGGTATNITAIVERSSRDPGSGQENWAPAEDEPFSGDLSAGFSPRGYAEPATGWWRVRVPTLEGGYVRITIVGEKV